MSSASKGKQLGRIFQQQINAAKELYQLLTDENEALIQRDYERTTQLIQLKQAKSIEIEALSRQLIQLLTITADTNANQETLDKFISELPDQLGNGLNQMRTKLEKITLSCQSQNIINGQIIAVNKQSAETALAILRGQFSTNELTYGAGGQPIKDQPAKPLIKA